MPNTRKKKENKILDPEISRKTGKRKFYKGYQYTLTIYDYEFLTTANFSFNKNYVQYFFGKLEACPDTGKLHYQSFVQFKKECKNAEMCQHWLKVPSNGFNAKYSNGTSEQNQIYCIKEDTSILTIDGKQQYVQYGEMVDNKNDIVGQNMDDLVEEFIKDIKANMKYDDLICNHLKLYIRLNLNKFKELYTIFKPLKKIQTKKINVFMNWQQSLLTDMAEDEEYGRNMNVVLDQVGKNEKSVLAANIYNKAIDDNVVCQLLDTGDSKDLAFMIKEDVELVILDLARSETNINWKFLENLRNGILMSPKYESCMKVLDTRPKIIIMCNSLPPNLHEKISIDKLRIYDLLPNNKFNKYENLNDKSYLGVKFFDKNELSFHDVEFLDIGIETTSKTTSNIKDVKLSKSKKTDFKGSVEYYEQFKK